MEQQKTKNVYPPGWDEARVQRLLDHHENIDEDCQLEEDESALSSEEHTMMAIPCELVPVVRALIARHSSE